MTPGDHLVQVVDGCKASVRRQNVLQAFPGIVKASGKKSELVFMPSNILLRR
jgi:hypothetical protein